MSIKIGGIDLAGVVLEALHRVSVLEKIVDAQSQGRTLNQNDIEQFRAEALENLKERFPDAGIKKN
ncbi:MAG: hypothetical protein WD016_03325 [Balneolaceae bacterium]